MSLQSLLVSLASVCLLAAPATAQVRAADEGTVTGNGVVTIKRQPEIMRMQIELSVKGKTAADALAKLKARREASEKKLLDLAADKESIKHGDAHVVAANTDRQRQMEMMVAERMRQSGKKPVKKIETEPVTIAASLTAEWPLKAASPDELLIAAQTLVEKIRAADLAGVKTSAAASAEDQEAAEEAAALADRYGGSNQPAPGEPRFIYVSKITAVDENKALADAFADAKRRAMQLSSAAGAKLGALRSLNGDASSGASADDYFNSGGDGGELYRYQMMMQRSMGPATGNPHEAVGPEPTTVMHAVRIMATFSLK